MSSPKEFQGENPGPAETRLAENPGDRFLQRPWQRIILLIVLGYEGMGALLGGFLLIVSPDGRLMDMPVEIMHGFFNDFLVPGLILLGLGILNTGAFFSVLRRQRIDWLLSGLGLGGLFIWFVVEIIILQELHWLHAMWGLPVLFGCFAAYPLIKSRFVNSNFRNAKKKGARIKICNNF